MTTSDTTVNTGGGIAVGGNVQSSRDFVGRDQINLFVTLGSREQAPTVISLGELGLKASWLRPAEFGRRLWMNAVPRQQELQTIYRIIGPGQHSTTTLTLWGMPGGGKSTLASLFVNQFGERYKGGVLWVDLGPDFIPEQALQPILARWAGWCYGGSDAVSKAMQDHPVEIRPVDIQRLLSGKDEMLVVFDDVWHIEHVHMFLDALPDRVNFLLTTRTRSLIRDLKIDSREYEVKELTEQDALELIQDKLADTPGGQIPETILRELATAYGYHAYALKTVASELSISSIPRQKAQILLQRRQQGQAIASVQTAFEASYDALPTDQDRLYLRLSGILRGRGPSFSINLIAAIWDAPYDTALATLEQMRERALFTHIEGELWTQQVLLQEFVNAKLIDSNEREIALDRYIRYVISIGQKQAIWSSNQPDLPHLLSVGNFMATQIEEASQAMLIEHRDQSDRQLVAEQWDWFVQAGRYYATAAEYLLLHAEVWSLAERWFKSLIAIGQTLDEPDDEATGHFILGRWYLLTDKPQDACNEFAHVAEIGQAIQNIQIAGYGLIGKGTMLSLLGQTEEAVKALRTALDLTEGIDDIQILRLRAEVLTALSSVFLRISAHEKAHNFLVEASKLATDTLKSEHLSWSILSQMGLVLLYQGKQQEALVYFTQAKAIAEQIEDERALANLSVNLGHAYLQMGEHELANECFTQAMHNAEMLPYLRVKLAALNGLAALSSARGHFAQALPYLQEALPLAISFQDTSQEAQVRAHFGTMFHNLGKPDEALIHLKIALPLLSQVQDTTTGVNVLNAIGMIYQQSGRLVEGLAYLQESLPIIKQLNNAGAEVTILYWLGLFWNGKGDIREAMSYFDQAQPIIDRLENEIERATALTLTARFYQIIGELEKAYDVLNKVENLWRRFNDRTKLAETLIRLAEVSLHLFSIEQTQRHLDEVSELLHEAENTLILMGYHNLQGIIFIHQGHIDDAQRMFERVSAIVENLESQGFRITNLHNLAWVRLIKRDFQTAKSQLESALTLAKQHNNPPMTASVFSSLGWLAYIQGEHTTSTDYFTQAIQTLEQAGLYTDLSGHNIDTLHAINMALNTQNGESIEAESLKIYIQSASWESIQFVLQARSTILFSPEADGILAQTIERIGQERTPLLGQVLRSYQQLLRNCRKTSVTSMQKFYREFVTPEIEQWWAYIHRTNYNYNLSLAHINRILERTPNHVDARIELGWLQRGLGRLDEAIADFDRALLITNDYRAWQGKGVVYFEMGKFDQAMIQLVQARNLAPSDSYTYQWRGAVYQAIGDQKSALKDLEEAIAIDPENSTHHYWRALMLLDEGQISEARNELNSCIKWDVKNELSLAFNYFWRGVAHDLLKDSQAARFDWERGKTFARMGLTLWSKPLFAVVANESSETIQQHYQSLLQRPYPWHILPSQIRNFKLLRRLYPENINYEEVINQLCEVAGTTP